MKRSKVSDDTYRQRNTIAITIWQNGMGIHACFIFVDPGIVANGERWRSRGRRA